MEELRRKHLKRIPLPDQFLAFMKKGKLFPIDFFLPGIFNLNKVPEPAKEVEGLIRFYYTPPFNKNSRIRGLEDGPPFLPSRTTGFGGE